MAETANVTLYHWEPNANSGKPMLTLFEKGVAFDSHYLDLLNFDQHKPDYLAINPNAKVPAIVDGDVTVFDSSAILLYLAEKTGKFLPAKGANLGDKARAELLSWMFFISSRSTAITRGNQLISWQVWKPMAKVSRVGAARRAASTAASTCTSASLA